MISFEEALNTVLHIPTSPVSETTPLTTALSRIVSIDIHSDIDIPPADMSAMDGFACRFADVNNPLRIIETIAAGHVPQKAIGPRTCSRIMTGAVVPEGTDHVVMVEHTTETDGCVRIGKQSHAHNIRYKAEDIRCGDTVITRGTLITPAVIAALASAGCSNVNVYKKIRVGIIATGDELVEPSQQPGPGQIRNSNSYQLFAQTLACGGVPCYYGIAIDTPDATESIIQKALTESDIILLSGGVSAGNFDFVPDTLKKLGVSILFDSIAMKPGKPTLCGTLGDKTFFGMPGNPVSTFVVFEMLVRPFLLKAMGNSYAPLIVKSILKKTLSRKKADRLEFLPISFDTDGFIVHPEYHGSAHIHSYTKADGIITMPKRIDCIEAGTQISVKVLGR